MRKSLISVSVIAILGVCFFAGSAIAQVDWGTYIDWPIAKIKINNQLKEPPSPAIIINGTTYVPLRFISESTGIGVDWDQVNRTVLLTNDSSSSPTNQNQTPEEYKSPPVSQTGKGITITINSLTVNATTITMNVTVENNSGKDCDFAALFAKVVIGSTQYDVPTDFDETFLIELKPGVSKTGNIVFPGAPPASKLKVYFETMIGDSSFDNFTEILSGGGSLEEFNPVFYVQQGS